MNNKYVKKFENYEDDSLMKYKKIPLMNYNEAITKFIIGQKVISEYEVAPFGDYNLPSDERYYGYGLSFENGYKMIHYGGGCSGEDCNNTYIIDPNDKLIARL